LERAAGAEEGKVNVLVDEGEVMGTGRDSVVGAVVGAGAVWAAALLLPTAALRLPTAALLLPTAALRLPTAALRQGTRL
jgi:hypothetical protein